MSIEILALCLITLVAATVNGALGYGFSSLTVPMALFLYTNRVLNPALVLIEVVLNGYVLVVNRASLPVVWRRMLPIVIGLGPGVIAGTLLLTRVDPGWMKLWVFAALIPLILLQAAGYRRPLKDRRRHSIAFGSGLGTLYAVTTISGPPLAVLLNNQGYQVRDFRAALGMVRFAESLMTAVAYLLAGLFTTTTLGLSAWMLPSLAVGVPFGAFLIRRIDAETFRRVCMSFDAWVVGFGLASVLQILHIANRPVALSMFVSVAAVDSWLLYRFFTVRRARRQRERPSNESAWAPVDLTARTTRAERGHDLVASPTGRSASDP